MSEENKNPVWFRQEGESETAFALFKVYLESPLPERTAAHVARKKSLTKEYIRAIRAKQRWNERAAAYDAHLEAARTEKAFEAAGNVEFDWQTWERENLNRMRELTDKLFAKANVILTDEKTKFTGADICRLAEAAVILSEFSARRAKALNPPIIPNHNLPKPPKPLDDLDAWTDEELDDYAKRCREARQKVARGEPLDDDEKNDLLN